LLKKIDRESKKETIMLLGISAGASLAMNAFMQRLDKVEKMVSLCGRLRRGWSDDKIRKKLQKGTMKHRAFKESVKLLEHGVKDLKRKDKKRIMTISAKFGDELIPIETSKLEGAKNILIPTIEHVLSIFSGMTANFEPIRKFLLGKK
jgi:pimeloyl-ACP methyl ester carboxylesterase